MSMFEKLDVLLHILVIFITITRLVVALIYLGEVYKMLSRYTHYENEI